MIDFSAQKILVRAFYDQLFDDPSAAFARYVAPDALWRGFHPFNEIRDPKAVVAQFWQPLLTSLTRMQRRMDIFMAGHNRVQGQEDDVWVVSMGHLMGLFDAPWLGIAPTGKLTMLRYCEFHRVAGDRIVETAMYFDIPHVMIQAGLMPFAPQTGAHLVQPGPLTHDGLMYQARSPQEGDQTWAVIDAMINDLGTWQSGLPLEEELARTWRDDMLWWGPAGIGSSYTIERYAKQHSGPFRAAFSDRSKTQHICRLAEGAYGGFFGWPNFTARHDGGFMGMPASEGRGEMRVIDMYRRDGDKLAENWIFMDVLHFWKGLGVDILERMQQVPRT